ncbi:MAG: DegV family protein [Clostridia bacterium]|jgi:DegV family protein with EDD domain|nr:DegV family protein [Clostridia bacterium]MCI2000197.1 DegV family protein [Clostridia bacterium]MCI2014638.1 DegV family protein [Clostridia bacterium]
MPIVISTESCSDVSEENKKKYGIYSVPMHVVFPDRDCDDGKLDVQEVYDFFNKTKQVPKTSAVNPQEFKSFFKKIQEEVPGAQIVHIGYSSLASSTYQNAVTAVEELENVFLIDSRNVSGGAGAIAIAAAQMLRDEPEINVGCLVKKLKAIVPKVKTCFVPDKLEYLVAGGRCSNASVLLASVLRVKPRIDIVDGKLIATKKYRNTISKFYNKLIDDFLENEKFDMRKAYIIYTLGSNKDVLEKMKETLMSKGFEDVELTITGSVMATHGGEGAVGLVIIRA